MTARGFAGLSPDSAGPATPAHDTGSPARAGPRGGRSRRRMPWPWLVAGAVVAVVVLIVAALSSGDESGTNTEGDGGFAVRAAHGPTRVVDNVPAGYSRDRAGAATAAVNVVQALAQAGQGRIGMAAVASVLVAADPGPQLRKSIEVGRDRADDSNVLNVLPAAVSVLSYSDNTAEVSVWTVGVSRSTIGPGDPVSVVTVWSTNTVSLVWRDGDWKAQEKTGRVGPTADEVVAPNSGSPLTAPLLGGYYSFYVQ
ncbi:hypothetical protein [Nocardia blacklockiae]|uniref:hypothetical protein n=1 Tax=Nocardia blacklockiae TaxID=480036 RepID=UPI0018942881|nr:hypothetical protein [Nocardia blacklockiae]MBF6171131.1 hypothetical protein [Nocardia blacklockiae]